ncbi:MAG: hypothetical protein P4L10_03205 [Acidobacteriaceae bacterium]|jgi:hypothetical protein|nr:hypothetical protein [Acidobacteriaceae bacterium]
MSQKPMTEFQARQALRSLPLAADSVRVGRTHRVVHERAMEMQQTTQQRRTLWLPLTIGSAMTAMLCYAVWMGLAQYDMAELSDDVLAALRGGSQMMLLGLWFLPVTATALIFVWMRRNHHKGDDSV